MRLYETAFNPARYQEYQQPQMGGMLGQMMGGQDWRSMLGNIDMENMMPGLGMDMQTGKMNTDYDLSNPDMLAQNLPYQSMQGGFGTQTNPGLSLTGGSPGSFDLGGGQSYSMLDLNLNNEPWAGRVLGGNTPTLGGR